MLTFSEQQGTPSNLRSTRMDAVGMAGGMGRRSGPTLAERGLLPTRLGPPPPLAATADRERRGHAVVARHCWVAGPPDCPGRWAGLLVEWRQEPDSGRWAGRVVYVVDDAGRSVLVETWVDADHLTPA
jgi:hypothetical protein